MASDLAKSVEQVILAPSYAKVALPKRHSVVTAAKKTPTPYDACAGRITSAWWS
ncbi:hypothetical protein [Streptomyces sp. NPDC095817]|uniref:hypothetical protein n=1 Tax=Streptomyces sp. NPDC095817 TaxID=3155082 RepID=UPI00331CF823